MNNLIIFLFLLTLLTLIAGLISPSLFKKLFRSEKFNRKYILKIFGSLSVFLFFLIAVTTEPVSPPIPESKNSVVENNVIASEQPTQNSSPLNSVTQVEDNTQLIQNLSPLYSVTQVVDGDTIKVDIDGQIKTLRLIGIDTPETLDPRKPVQCFGKEASNKAKELLRGKKVRLESDSTQGELDVYGRLLRYVFLEDGTFYNQVIIAEGYAHEYTYQSNPYKYQAAFKDAEKRAREASLGLWGANTCNGDTTKPAVAPSINIVPAAVIPAVAPVIASTEPQVKKSSTNICHEKGTTYYSRTLKFTSYISIDDCLNSGGRLPKV